MGDAREFFKLGSENVKCSYAAGSVILVGLASQYMDTFSELDNVDHAGACSIHTVTTNNSATGGQSELAAWDAIDGGGMGGFSRVLIYRPWPS